MSRASPHQALNAGNCADSSTYVAVEIAWTFGPGLVPAKSRPKMPLISLMGAWKYV